MAKILITILFFISLKLAAAPSGIPSNFSCPDTYTSSSSLHTWSAVSGASYYRIRTKQSFDGEWETTDQGQNSVYSTSSARLTNLRSGSYKSYLNACDSSGCGSTVTCSFTVSAPPPPQVPVPKTATNPVNDAINGSVYKDGTQGKYYASNKGSLIYNLPIKIPRGIENIEPDLSLRYDSSQQNGITGHGWSLTGYSYISRCPASLIRDGYRSGVNHNDDYKYCFNNERLIEVSNNEFRLENEQYIKFRRNPSSDDWVAFLPNGQEQTFGDNQDSKLKDSSGFAYKWFITSTKDQYSNSIIYSYYYSNSSINLNKIEYTKNNAGGSNHSINFFYENRKDISETFIAGNKEIIEQRLSSIIVQTNDSQVRNYLIDYYVNDYEYDGAVYNDPLSISRIRSITQCHQTDFDCSAPVVFKLNTMTPNKTLIDQTNYYNLEDDIANHHYGNGILLPEAGYRPLKGKSLRGDFDGDNKQEIVWWECTNFWCRHYAQMSSNSAPILIAYNIRKSYGHNHISNIEGTSGSSMGQVIDINGDGLDDYVITSLYKDHGYQFYLSNGTTFTHSLDYSLSFEELSTYKEINYDGVNYNGRYSNFIELEDINGDGLIDILKTTAAKSRPYFPVDLFAGGYNKIEVAINNGNGFNSFTTWGELTSYPALTSADFAITRNVNIPNLVDLNGDGRKDIISFFPGGGVQVGINNGSAFVPNANWASSWGSFPSLQGATINMFGQKFYDCPTQVVVTEGAPIESLNIGGVSGQISSGFNFATSVSRSGNRNYRYENNLVKYGDFNGDGLTDVAYLREDGIYVTLSTGSSFEAPSLWTTDITLEQVSCGFGYPRESQQFWSVADVNLDGKTDVILNTHRIDGNNSGPDDINNHYILFSSNSLSSDSRLYFSEPILATSMPYNYNSEGLDLFSTLEITASGQLIFIDGYRLTSLPDKNPYDITEKEQLNEWNNYHSILDTVQITEIISNFGATTVHIDYKNLIGNNDIYTETNDVSSDNSTIQSVSNNSLFQFSSLYGGLNRTQKATVPYIEAQNLKVIANITEFFNGELTQDRSYSYKNLTRHKFGYGLLGFEEVTEVQRKGDNSELSGKNLKIVSKYHQKATDNYLLSNKLYSKEIFATDSEDNEVDYEISNRLISRDLYDWKVSAFYDDIDPSLSNPDYADSYNYYRDSPHYYQFLLREQKQTFELNTGNLTATKVTYLLHEDNETVPKTVCNSFTLNSSHSTTLNLDSYFDSYGNPREIVEQHCDSFSITGKHTKNQNILNVDTYSEWYLGLVQGPKTIHWNYDYQPQNLDQVTRESRFIFNNKGRVEYETVEPNSSNEFWKQNYYTYNAYGSLLEHKETVRDFTNDGLTFTNRVTKYNEQHNQNGLRKLIVTNPLNQTSEVRYDERYNEQVYFRDVNNQITLSSLDNYGRIEEIKHPNNTTTLYDYIKCNNCFSYNLEATWYKQEKQTGLSANRVYFDALDREVGKRNKGLQGHFNNKYYQYNALGNLVTESNFFDSSSNLAETNFFYDLLNRPTSVHYPTGATETSYYGNFGSYSNFSNSLIVKENSLGNRTYYEKNALGKDKIVTDTLGTKASYGYDALGNMSNVEIKGTLGSQTHTYTIDYDKLSRKTRLIDPNVGQITYQYNALGLLTTQTNGINQVTRYSYDKLDRQIKRVDDANNSGSASRTHAWIYDNKTNGIGSLGLLTGYDSNGTSFKKDYTYNALGLPDEQSTTISGENYELKYLYNNHNRFSGYHFHDGYSVLYAFNNYGYKHKVYDGDDNLLWQAYSDDAFGNITNYSYGNGDSITKVFDYQNGLIDTIHANRYGINIQSHDYDFDTEGNLRKRQDGIHNVTQVFCYDELNRLTDNTPSSCSDVANGNYTNTDYAYDILGNITKKENISDYQYGTNAGPNAVTYANGSRYYYNTAGQMTSGGGRTIRYTSYGKPYHMAKGSYSTSIVYGSDFKRAKRIENENGQKTTTTYIDKLTEIVNKPNGTSEVRHYLDDFAIRTKSSSNEELVYLHRDHIGSIVAKTTQQLSNSSHIKYQANEPWGRRQNIHWNGTIYNELTGSLLAQNTYATTRGFTDHEHLDGVGLIHMNGRVYDPIVGRFVSPDPWIQEPSNSQSFNRYSYVWNNPLRYTDPSGEVVKAAVTATKIAYKLKKKADKNGKLDKDSIGETLKEEGMDMLDDAMTLADPDAGILDKGAATIDLFLGTEFNNKKVNGLNNQVKNNADNSLTKLDEKKPEGVTKRPGGFRKKTLKDSWDNAADGTKPDTKQCPTCGKDIKGNPHKGEKRNGPDGWDNDHHPKWKDRDLDAMNRKEVLDEYNKDTRLRCPSCNRSDNQ
ncbi:RHS repeat-associated core domain-containing protein [Thalassotalea sp. PLHSN55]|uniref:RHS repeat-associated core domain-containing protein n=1 Tax=Thalassotalea sp. PLHSN55 TaxID=3435888 RepID=UPI003F87EC62